MSLTPDELKLIGGSDASALVGMNPYKNPHDIFARIVEGREDPETKPMRRGTLMEPVIRALAAEELGLTFTGPRKLRVGDWGRANLDDVIASDGGEEVAEFKSVGPFADGEYGETMTDEIPRHHLCQVQFYMAATGLPRARLVALIGVDDLRQYIIRADTDLQGVLIEECERFWKDNILPGKPPPIDASGSCARWLEERYPRAGGLFVPGDDEAAVIASRLRLAREQKAAAEAIEDECRNLLIARIGDAAGISGRGWQVAYGNVKGRLSTDWKAVAAEAGVPNELIQKHTRAGAGYRAFKPTFKEPK